MDKKVRAAFDKVNASKVTRGDKPIVFEHGYERVARSCKVCGCVPHDPEQNIMDVEVIVKNSRHVSRHQKSIFNCYQIGSAVDVGLLQVIRVSGLGRSLTLHIIQSDGSLTQFKITS